MLTQSRYLMPLLLLAVISVVQANDLTIATESWDDYTNTDQTGYYFDLLAAAFPKATIKAQFVPFARSVAMIEAKQVVITLGVNRGDVEQALLSASPIEKDWIDVGISQELAATWQGITSLKNRKVAARNEYGFDSLVNFPMDYRELPKISSMVMQLQNGRVDAIMDYKEDILEVVTEKGLQPKFVVKEAVVSADTYFAFANNQVGKKAKAQFDTYMAAAIASGKIKELMKKSLGSLDSYPAVSGL